jgi:hypothetical protein
VESSAFLYGLFEDLETNRSQKKCSLTEAAMG